MKFQEYDDRAGATRQLARVLADELKDAVSQDGNALLCVPGGSTPGPVFDALAGEALPWECIGVVLNDERWVSETHPRSNAALLKRRLFVQNAAKAQFLPLYSGHTTPEEGIDSLEQQLAPHLPLTVLLLGMGVDMHTASLFPGGDRLSDALAPDAPLLVPMRSDGAGEPRITITAAHLNRARHKHLIIFGDEKRAAFETARALNALEAPIKSVLENITVHWAK